MSTEPLLLYDPLLFILLFSTMCLYIIITIMLWVLSIYYFIKHYTIVFLCLPYNLVICPSSGKDIFVYSLWHHGASLWCHFDHHVSGCVSKMFTWSSQAGELLNSTQQWLHLVTMTNKNAVIFAMSKTYEKTWISPYNWQKIKSQVQ